MFADSSPLVPADKVSWDGIAVGTISSISLVNGLARSNGHRPPRCCRCTPTRAGADPAGQPAGERFVALKPGTRRRR